MQNIIQPLNFYHWEHFIAFWTKDIVPSKSHDITSYWSVFPMNSVD